MPRKTPQAPTAPSPATALPVTALREDANHTPTLVWFANENNQQFVKELLMDPRFQSLCYHVAARAEVTEDQLVNNPVPDAVIIRQSAVATGLRSFPRVCFMLLNAATKKAPQELVPYAHIQPEPQ